MKIESLPEDLQRWFRTKPPEIQEMIRKKPPGKYRTKETKDGPVLRVNLIAYGSDGLIRVVVRKGSQLGRSLRLRPEEMDLEQVYSGFREAWGGHDT